MHSHPRFWRMPFPHNNGACNPHIKQSTGKLLIAESGSLHKLLALLLL